MLYVSEHKALVDQMLMHYGLPVESLEIVPSVHKWCDDHSIEEKNPSRIAKCLCRRSDGACHIVICNEITESMISLAKSGMECHGFRSEVALLDSNIKFLVHTMLHEIACHVLKSTDQGSRDRWAFDEMHKHIV